MTLCEVVGPSARLVVMGSTEFLNWLLFGSHYVCPSRMLRLRVGSFLRFPLQSTSKLHIPYCNFWGELSQNTWGTYPYATPITTLRPFFPLSFFSRRLIIDCAWCFLPSFGRARRCFFFLKLTFFVHTFVSVSYFFGLQ